ncbi:MAG: PAS domain-containing protein [Pseudomonadota bacterium]|nr:PAS domain-containing protein [Pseudomonadota bacterium]
MPVVKALRNVPTQPAWAPEVWAELLDAILHAAWLVDAAELRIVAANAAAGRLCGAVEGRLVGRPVLDFAVTPEDHAFWREAASSLAETIESDTLMRRDDGRIVPVARRVGRLRSTTAAALCLVTLEDRGPVQCRERELEQTLAQLRATLDSLVDGIQVNDLCGGICNFNRRFAELWELPDELLRQRDTAAVLDWMQASVVDPVRYMRRLAAIDDAAMLRATDVVTLHSGRVVERVTLPQCSRGQPIGRIFVFREIRPAIRALRGSS